MHIAPTPESPRPKGNRRDALLVHDTNFSVEPLVTPDQADKAIKDKTTNIRKALVATRQRPKPVANAPADNGIADLCTELQATAGNLAMLAGVATVDSSVATVDTPSKRQRRELQVEQNKTIATALTPAGPAPIKCLGCIHVDLLDMNVMAPAHIKHYLKSAGVLEKAICAGECREAIKSIWKAAPKNVLHYCDWTIKGFHAPETDPEKADMECGLFLCVPCHANRKVQYDLQSKDGGKRRTSRRGRKN